MKNNLSIFRNIILWGTFLITFGWFTNAFAQAQCPVDNRLVTMPVADSKYYLPENYVFKVKFDAPISTDTYKTGSIVQFSVVDNVFGIKLPEFETKKEIEDFKLSIDKIVSSYKTEINKMLTSPNLKDTEKIKEIEDLYSKKTKEIEDLFDIPRNTLRLKIEEKYESDKKTISDNDPKKEEKLEKIKKDKDEKIEKLSKMPEVVVVIAKASKGFGKVERAKRQLPLFLNYKARISVVLDYVLLDNGDCIPIEIKESTDERLYAGKNTELGNVIDCKSRNLSGKKCIKGRRPQYKFIPPIISGIVAVATVLLDDPTAQALAGITAVNQLAKDDLGNILNGADAQISDKLIYEVTTTNSKIGTIKKEEKK